MTIPYRTRRTLNRLAIFGLCLVLIAVAAWLCWLLWLDRYVVYSQEGAKLDFSLSAGVAPGEVAVPPETGETVSIFYNGGENAVNTSTELGQLMGYYADADTLSKDVAAVRSQIESLPPEAAVMLDVKSIYGSFYYSTAVGEEISSSVDIGAMDNLISYLKSSGRYTIARVPAFQDYYYGLNHVSCGLPVSGGYLWLDEQRCYWLNPGNDGAISYLIQIATELKTLGFDEIVFSGFRFPDSKSIVFHGDRNDALVSAAEKLVSTCATDTFAVSFVVENAGFPLPQGRSRLYLEGISAANAKSVASQTNLTDTAIHLVFLAETNDTRYDEFSVLRPLSGAH